MRGPEGGFSQDRFRLPSPLQDARKDERGSRISPDGKPEFAAHIEAGSELEPQERPSAVFTTTEDRVELMADAQREVHGTDLTFGVTYAGESYPGSEDLRIPKGHVYVAVTANSEERITNFFGRVAVLKKEKGKQFAQLGFPKKAK